MTESKEGERELKRKVRVVACGNFALTTGDATFSATPDITALRLVLRLASFARKKGIKVRVSSTDVSVAFLNAPLETEYSVAITPPAILHRVGLIDPDEVWVLQKALYGLRESPRAWFFEKHKTMRQLEFQWNGKLVWLEQCKCEPGVWRIYTGAKRSMP